METRSFGGQTILRDEIHHPESSNAKSLEKLNKVSALRPMRSDTRPSTNAALPAHLSRQ
jgi:hypothetical protein